MNLRRILTVRILEEERVFYVLIEQIFIECCMPDAVNTKGLKQTWFCFGHTLQWGGQK